MKRTLIIFTRYPQPHRSKTRLIPFLGPEGAAELQGDQSSDGLAIFFNLSRNGLPDVPQSPRLSLLVQLISPPDIRTSSCRPES